MTQDKDKLKLFYETLKSSPRIEGLPDDYNVFESTMSDPDKAREFYNVLKTSPYIEGLPETEDEFLGGLGIKKKDFVGAPAEEEFLSEDFQEPTKDLSLKQRRQVLQSKYKEEGIDFETLSDEDIRYDDYSIESYRQSAAKTRALVTKKSFDLAEELQAKATEVAKTAETQEELNKEIESLEGEYTKKIEEINDSLTGYKYIEDEKDDYGKLFKNILDSNESYESKKAKVDQLKEAIVSSMPEESKGDIESEINRLITEVSMGTMDEPPSELTQQFVLKRSAENTIGELKKLEGQLLSEIDTKLKEKGIDPTSAATTPEAVLGEAKQLSKVRLAIDQLDRAIKTPEGKRGAGARAFGEELGNILTAGMASLFEDIEINNAINKQKKGEATEADKALIDAYGQYQQLSGMASEMVDRYRRYKSLAGSIPYIEQFLLTGGIGDIAFATARKAGASVLKKQALRGIRGMKGLTKRGVMPVVEGAVSMVGRLPLSPATYERVLEQRETFKYEDGKFVLDEEALPKWGEAIARGVYMNATELFSESLGGVVALPNWKAANRVFTPTVKKIFRRAGLQNPFGEYGEEIFAALFQGEKIDKRFLTDLLTVIPLMMAPFTLMTTPAMVQDIRLAKKAKFEKGVMAELKSFIEAKDEGGLANRVSELIEGKSEKEALNVIETAASMVQDDVVNEIQEQAETTQPTTEETTEVQEEAKVGEEAVQKTEQPVQETQETTERGQEEIVDEQISPQPEKAPQFQTIDEYVGDSVQEMEDALAKRDDLTDKQKEEILNNQKKTAKNKWNEIMSTTYSPTKQIKYWVSAINNGLITAKDAVSVIESGGLEVPQEISNLVEQKTEQDEVKKEEGLQEEAQEEVKQAKEKVVEEAMKPVEGTQRGRIGVKPTEKGFEVRDTRSTEPIEVTSLEEAKGYKERVQKDTEAIEQEITKREAVPEDAEHAIFDKTYESKEAFMEGLKETFTGKVFDPQAMMSSDIKKGADVTLTEVMDVINEVAKEATRLESIPIELSSTEDLVAEQSLVDSKNNIADKVVDYYQGEVKPTKAEEIAQRKEQAKGLISEGLDDLANLAGKKSLTGEERVSAVKAIQKIARGVIEGGIAEIDAIIEKVKEYLGERNLALDDDIVEEGVKNAHMDAIESPQPIISEETGETTTEKKETPTEPKTKVKEEERLKGAKKAVKGKNKISQTYTNTFSRTETDFQQEIAREAKADPVAYREYGHDEAIADAVAWIGERGRETATSELLKPMFGIKGINGIEDSPMVQVARQLLITYYSTKLVEKNLSPHLKETAYEKMRDLMQITAKEGTAGAQMTNFLSIFRAIDSPASMLRFTEKNIEDSNIIRLREPIEEGGKTVGQQLEESMKAMDDITQRAVESIVRKIIDGKIKGIQDISVKQKRRAKPTLKVPVEVKKQESEYRKQRIERFREELRDAPLSAMGNWAVYVEFAGDMLVSYVREGVRTVEAFLQNLKTDFEEAGATLTDAEIDSMLDIEYKDGVTYRMYAAMEGGKETLIDNINSLRSEIAKVIRKHFTETKPDETFDYSVNRELWEKLMEDAGLTEKEARSIEKSFKEEFKTEIEGVAKEEAGKLLGVKKVAKSKKVKSYTEKLIDTAFSGVLGTKLGRIVFADHFGLAAPPTKEQSMEILKLASIAKSTKDWGNIGRHASIRLGKYIHELYPMSKARELADDFIAVVYANTLSGPSTHFVNLFTGGMNIVLSPIIKTLSPTRIKRIVKEGTKAKAGIVDIIREIFSPLGVTTFVAGTRGMSKGALRFRDVMARGDVQNKFIEDVATKSMAMVTPMERSKYGPSKRFRPRNMTVKIPKIGKVTVDFNIKNAIKYVGRLLSATDMFMLTTAYEMELMSIVRDNKRIKDNMFGKSLRKEVMKIYKAKTFEDAAIVRKLEQEGLKGEELIEAINERAVRMYDDYLQELVDDQAQKYYEMSGIKLTDLQKKIRKRDLEMEKIPATDGDKAKGEMLGRQWIFTDDKGGMLSSAAVVLGKWMNKNIGVALGVKPFIMFTKILANVAELTMDFGPQGFLRAYNLTPFAAMKGLYMRKIRKNPMPKGSYLMPAAGPVKSQEWYAQMARAWFGTQAMVTLMALFLGTDDDDRIQITGGMGPKGYKKDKGNTRKRAIIIRKENGEVMFAIPYMLIPAISLPCAVIGDMNDQLALRKINPNDETRWEGIRDRFTLALWLDATKNSIFFVKDMAFVEGVAGLVDMLTSLFGVFKESEEKGTTYVPSPEDMELGEKLPSIVKEAMRTYGSFVSRALPQNNNAVKQIYKIFDPTSYSQKQISEIASYLSGFHMGARILGEDPSKVGVYPKYNVLGYKQLTYPYSTEIPYDVLIPDIKEQMNAPETKFLDKHNAWPKSLTNRPITIETEDGMEQRSLEPDEWSEYEEAVGLKFRGFVSEYIQDEERVKKRGQEKVVNDQDDTISGVQDDMGGLWSKARDETRTELFRWGQVKEDNPKAWAKIKEHKAYHPYAPSKEIEGYRLDKSELFRFNNYATIRYADEFMKWYDRKSQWLDKWKTKVVDEETGLTRFEAEINEMWGESKFEAEKKLRKELKEQGKL